MSYLGHHFSSSIPAGEYVASISNSEFRAAPSGNGQCLALTVKILEGPHAGRCLWSYLGLKNNDWRVVESAQRELSAICGAVGKMTISDSAQLHDIPLRIAVDKRIIATALGEWAEKNRIKKWMPLNAAPEVEIDDPADDLEPEVELALDRVKGRLRQSRVPPQAARVYREVLASLPPVIVDKLDPITALLDPQAEN